VDRRRHAHRPPLIVRSEIGVDPFGDGANLYTLTNAGGMVVRITNFGGIVTEIHAPDRYGRFADVALGLDSLDAYRCGSPYFGALIGRYGNRIREGRFTLDGETCQLPVNNGANHLHGGPEGFDRVLWQAHVEGRGLHLAYRSPDGDQGYPGNLDVTAVYTLTDDNELVVRFRAVTDKATPVNLTQHSYFNLAGGGDVHGHELTLDASAYLPVDAGLIPSGELAPVAATPFDFRQPQAIGARIDEANEQLQRGGGYDHCFVLAGTMARAARVFEPRSGRVLELYTQEPAVQFYSGNALDGSLRGKGRAWTRRSGFCLEPQHFPDSPNQPAFPNTILRPGEVYETESRFVFSTDRA
jgi:aldose 1-epimerase